MKRWSGKRLPQVNGRLYLNDLHHPIHIYRDKWGIPHIYAANRHDLFFAQGFVHAQDRLWQMELNRRAANGTLSAVFSGITLDTDRLSRTLGFARLARQNWETLVGSAGEDLIAYTKGVNACLLQTTPLPIEFTLLRHRPEPWQPVDSLAYGRLQMWALTHGAVGEWINAQVIERVGPEMAADLRIIYPSDNPITLPNGIEVNALRVAQNGMNTAVAPFMGKGSLDGAGRGSNAWVIGPERSATGHAILCNDMHLPMGTPSLWHLQHLHSEDGIHVTGFTLPGMPYVLVGHNAHIAWGATLAYTDCEDLFVERFNPQQPAQYRYQDEWRQAEIITEQIAVRGQPDHVETVMLTHHGPIITDVLFSENTPASTAQDHDYRTQIALSSTTLRPDVDVDGFGWLNIAEDWQAFVTAVSHIQSPSLNLLYADTADNIGHYVSGRVPIRAQGDGQLPNPGWTGSHEWVGTIPFNEMPHALNPTQGFIVSANHKLTNDAYPHHLGHNWRNGFRAQRIESVIRAQKVMTIADCRKLHLDCFHKPGLVLTSHLRDFHSTHPDALLSLHLLQQWDGWLGPESVGGAVFQVFLAQLTEAILQPYFERPFLFQLLGLGPHPHLAPVNDFQGQWLASLLAMFEQPESPWLPSGKAREQLLQECLAKTTHLLRNQLGKDPAQWQWGRLHQIRFAHALSQQPPFDIIFNNGPFPIGGDSHTVAQTGIRPDLPFDNNAISVSTRQIIDLGNLDNVLFIHAPGQSGNLGSPHYNDMIQSWLTGDYVNVAWEKEQVTAVCPHHLTTQPAIPIMGFTRQEWAQFQAGHT